ncbi:MAG: glycosyltransferase [Syntrophales bacterium]|nr:glycosyltransferase [Syntrophales bacterium]
MGGEKRGGIAAVVMACGEGMLEPTLDTLESVRHYCPEAHSIVIVDDLTRDGTYESLQKIKGKNWHILRNAKRNGLSRLTHTLQAGYRFILENLGSPVVLKLDTDALIIRTGILSEALQYAEANPRAGMFGVYEVDFNRPRTYVVHTRVINRAMKWWRALIGLRPAWRHLLLAAEANGYIRGENVFGGSYFISIECLRAMDRIGGLSMPRFWKARLQEDVYFSMAAIAAGYRLGHFAAPSGPLCLDWKGLPYPAREIWERGYKLVHSVDRGPNTGSEQNGGMRARDIFRAIRMNPESFSS